MKFLVVGLGSMGKRRVRNLIALGYREIAGVDPREDRRMEASNASGIRTFAMLEQALNEFSPDALVVSTPPDMHMDVAFFALSQNLPCFIEASVVDAPRIARLDEEARKADLVMVPSCTMRYFAGPRKVTELLKDGVIGNPLNISYQTGQYLPDWHPWERIEDFYVSRRETGGAREIVPFELTWLNAALGEPVALACVKAKLTDMSADIDDVYHCLLRYPGGVLCNMSVDVIARPTATRELRILGTHGQIVMSADEQVVRYCSSSQPETWTRYSLAPGTVEDGYINPEEPYIAEMADYVAAVAARDASLFPNSLQADVRVLECLHALEQLCPQDQP